METQIQIGCYPSETGSPADLTERERPLYIFCFLRTIGDNGRTACADSCRSQYAA